MLRFSNTERARIADGLCCSCEAVRGDNGTATRCRSCATAVNVSSKARRERRCAERSAKGLCIKSGKGSQTNGFRCADCAHTASLSSQRLQARRWLAVTCRACSKPRLPAATVCREHWFRERSRWHFGHEQNWERLIAFAESQNWRCVYTGEHLSAGDNMSLDHKISKTHPNFPGPDDWSNLAWTTRATNLAKNDRTVAEFLNLCRRVVSHADTPLLDVEGLHQQPYEASTGRYFTVSENPRPSGRGRC